MLLAIDARNGSVSVGFRSGSSWVARRSFGSAATRTADEFALLLGLAASADGVGQPGGEAVDLAIVSSVVPALTPRLVAAARRAFGVEALVVGPGTRTGLRIRSDLPQELGSDIVCLAVAARSLATGRPCVVLDFGDALVFGALNSAGDFLGAAIAPGLGGAARELHASAALLPEVSVEAPVRAIGRTTRASLQSGLHHGYAGLVQRLVSLFRTELAEAGHEASSIELIATGDPAGRALVAGLEPLRFVPDLALEGLATLAEGLRERHEA